MHYVYHPDHEPKVVSTEDRPTYFANGWFDTPAKFPKKDEMIVLATEEKRESHIKNQKVRP